MNTFEQKRQARIDRMRERSATKAIESDTLLHKHDALLGVMNGTPILRGHHSEGRHIRDLARIDRDMRKGFEAAKESETLARRADAAEESTAISSDDPEALTKLRAKLVELEENGALMVADMKRARQAIKGKTKSEGTAALKEAGIHERIRNFYHHMGNLPALSNDSAERRRIKARIEELEKRATVVPTSETLGDIEISEEDNRTRLRFQGKPSAATIARLKDNGFRWAPSLGVWQRHQSSFALQCAREIASKEQR